MKTIYFHVGISKTGTSFLQSAFAFNAKNYEKYDLIYLDTDNNFDDAIKGKTTSGNAIGIASSFNSSLALEYPPINFSKLIADLDRSKNYLFSSEWLSASPKFFEKIHFFLDGKFNYKFIAFIRNPVDLLKSNYLQSLKIGQKKSIEDKAKEYTTNLKNMFNYLLNIKNLFLVNYDIHKDNLISVIDKLIFDKKVSVQTPVKIVNPSPNNHQANILRLANNLKINNFGESMKYAEKNQQTLDQDKFKMSRLLYEDIYNDLSLEINEINKLLPEKEKITLSYDDCNETSSQTMFSNDDVCFLRECINKANNIVSKEDLSFIRQSIKKSIETSEVPADFDALGYLLLNRDVLSHRVDPIDHFLRFGIKEGRKWR
jgi:hypothetical protein